MKKNSHLNSLIGKFKKLEHEIHDAYIHHLPTNNLKKKRLILKQEIQKFS